MRNLCNNRKVSNVRNPALDGVRGVAVVMVVLYHAGAVRFGWSGVDLFFVLSGYLLASQLLTARLDGRAVAAFYVRRALRVLPLYLLMLAAYLAVVPAASPSMVGAEPRWVYAAFLQNFWHPRTGAWMSVTWSLAVEEHFYAALPIAVLLIPRRRVGAWCVVACAATVTVRAAMISAGASAALSATPARLDGLALGVLAATIPISALAVRERHLRVGSLALWATLALCSGALGWDRRCGAVGPLLAALAALATVAWVVGGGRSAVLESGAIRWLGRRCYAVYLFHVPAMHLLGTVAGIAVALALAEVSWWLVEHPATVAGARLSSRISRRPASTTVGSSPRAAAPASRPPATAPRRSRVSRCAQPAAGTP